jgi:hypothetical protein
MSDQHPTLPLPDLDARWVLSTDASTAPARKRRWPWLVALIAVVALAVAAWFAGEYIARGIVERTIREQITTQLSLPADQHIDIDIPGQVLPQLISGRFGELTIAGDDVPLGGDASADSLTGDVVVRAVGVPIRRNGSIEDASASVTLDRAQLQTLLGSIDGFPASTVALDESNIDITMDLQLFALTVSVGVGLTPSVSAGQLVLTPATLKVAGADISAEALVDQFGAIARTAVRDWNVCIAKDLPAGLTLTDARVAGQTVVADFAIDGAILHDPALQQPGSCA